MIAFSIVINIHEEAKQEEEEETNNYE